MLIKRWYFRLASGDWGYVDAETREHAIREVEKWHGEKPVRVEQI